MNRTQLAINAQGARPISKEQVRALIVTASAAWKRQRALGLTEDTFDAWRKAALWDAVAESSFRAVTQGLYAQAMDHFAVLAGGQPKADPAAEDAERRARWKLQEVCGSLGAAFAFDGRENATAYARGLFRKIHRTSLEDATAGQIWQVIYTLNNRISSKLKGKRIGD
jgi:hypothetical protein